MCILAHAQLLSLENLTGEGEWYDNRLEQSSYVALQRVCGLLTFVQLDRCTQVDDTVDKQDELVGDGIFFHLHQIGLLLFRECVPKVQLNNNNYE